MTFAHVVKHEIKTHHSFEKEVESQIQDMLKQGIIRHSQSPYCSPLWILPKKKDASGK